MPAFHEAIMLTHNSEDVSVYTLISCKIIDSIWRILGPILYACNESCRAVLSFVPVGQITNFVQSRVNNPCYKLSANLSLFSKKMFIVLPNIVAW